MNETVFEMVNQKHANNTANVKKNTKYLHRRKSHCFLRISLSLSLTAIKITSIILKIRFVIKHTQPFLKLYFFLRNVYWIVYSFVFDKTGKTGWIPSCGFSCLNPGPSNVQTVSPRDHGRSCALGDDNVTTGCFRELVSSDVVYNDESIIWKHSSVWILAVWNCVPCVSKLESTSCEVEKFACIPLVYRCCTFSEINEGL